ncbi:glycosyltransferase [Desulfococcaceae bacterium HSG7]|nr:glycosyltransferase [Desulfococcaceae bacterium HSG7]
MQITIQKSEKRDSQTMRVSVIIPVYNAAKTVEDCILSIINQSLSSSDYEIIVIDNKSIDQTKSIINKYPVCYKYEPYPSVYKARNTGFAISSGEIIAFIDGDCIADKDWLKNGAHTMDQFKVATGLIVPQLSHRKILYLYDKVITWKSPQNQDFNINAGNCFIDRKLFMEIGGFNESVITAGDSILSMIAKQKGYRIGLEPRAKVYHPVAPFIMRFRRCFREGMGSCLKDSYKFGNTNKIERRKMLKIKIFNFVNGLLTDLNLIWAAKNATKINGWEMFLLYIFCFFFTFQIYAGTIVARYFKKLNKKIALK